MFGVYQNFNSLPTKGFVPLHYSVYHYYQPFVRVSKIITKH